MPTRILVDTSFVIALINQRDQRHREAQKLANKFEGHPLLITEAVLLEVGNAMARSYKKKAIQIIEDFLTSDEVEIVHLSQPLFNEAFMLYKQYQDKEWSLVDCASFAVMGQRGLLEAFTTDHHFEQAGFVCLLKA